ncbi:hypothetical protein C4573_05320 [Candidatus Woesearchaeota archaeon]|nr:MAG: hypothetical protein C4573_05320 [Candidatus Woesearchaeota archaeon]
MLTHVPLPDLEYAIYASWNRGTSAKPERWNNNNPALGQCAVTALVVQDYLEGEIVWAEVSVDILKISHYFNLVDGKEIDFTRSQFPQGTIVPKGIPRTGHCETTREYVLSYPSTVQRYKSLKRSVEEVLAH